MCGRYMSITPAEGLKRLFGFVETPNLPSRYNIVPTQEAPVVRQRRDPQGERTVRSLRWGLVPAWAADPTAGPPLVNARAETLLEKPSFRSAFRRRRCLVPADGYYQWREGDAAKLPYLVTRHDGAPFAFAGIWERWGPRHDPAAAQDSFTIITSTANEFMRPFHHRMPVVLAPEHFALWLDPDAETDDLLGLLGPAANEMLRCFPVDRAVNTARAEGPDLIAPTGPALVWPGVASSPAGGAEAGE